MDSQADEDGTGAARAVVLEDRRGSGDQPPAVWTRQDAEPVVGQLYDVVVPAWDLALERATAVSVVLVEIDWFDRYRQRYGDAVAEACLVEVASAAARTVPEREDAGLFRYDTHRLALVLPGTDRSVARQSALALTAEIAARRYEHAATRSGLVTLSVGVAAAVPAREGDPVDLVLRADAALFTARESGHDRVECS